MACARKVRQAPNDTDAASDDSQSRGRRLRGALWRALRRATVRALAVSVIVTVARRVVARRHDASSDAIVQPVEPPRGVAEWPPLLDTDTPGWIDPVDGQCPLSHPVKGNASSKIYHVPGSRFYDMTSPERCYRDTAAAEADGMRAPKR